MREGQTDRLEKEKVMDKERIMERERKKSITRSAMRITAEGEEIEMFN